VNLGSLTVYQGIFALGKRFAHFGASKASTGEITWSVKRDLLVSGDCKPAFRFDWQLGCILLVVSRSFDAIALGLPVAVVCFASRWCTYLSYVPFCQQGI
jgi:hypothetical protein